ncbi:NADPH-dependent F420 reductase [Streptomyces sp. WI04-05B]|nr:MULTISPECIES: NADPH-dependent F420 reductase [unclassified Streptomyces]MDX2545940.1 NADPH-dependent F420 reductase [Streptomyces sp. WI04-05B]MDX2582759.1 NADPH-dependent F420 reductase [Streptomyces sp. WI04-05A]
MAFLATRAGLGAGPLPAGRTSGCRAHGPARSGSKRPARPQSNRRSCRDVGRGPSHLTEAHGPTTRPCSGHALARTFSPSQGRHVMRIGIIGAGALGQALAVRFVAAGEEVLLSDSRGPRSLREAADSIGPGLTPTTVPAAADAEIVVLAVPWRELTEAVVAAEVSDWQERIVIDATNPLGPPDFRVVDLQGRPSSEVVAGLVPGARLVKAFNTLAPAVLGADPRTPVGRRVIFLSGDHPGANSRVARLVEHTGWAAVDLGRLADGGRLQQFPGGPLPTLSLLLQP